MPANHKVKTLLLLGGGHAHLAVLHQLKVAKPKNWRVILATPNQHQIYSGMLPGWIAGHYILEECRIDLLPLCQAAKIDLILDMAIQIDEIANQVSLSSGLTLSYDLLSIDIGGETDLSALTKATDKLIPIRPLDQFITHWQAICDQLRQGKHLKFALVGGGAAGFELTLAIHHRLQAEKWPAQLHWVYSEQGILPSFSPTVRQQAIRALQDKAIIQHAARATGTSTGLQLSNGQELDLDYVFTAAQVRPPSCISGSQLAISARGFIAINTKLQSTSHANVFAAGDVASQAVEHAKSGVHAVRAGPTLARNLLRVMQSKAPTYKYKPKKTHLYLLATGSKHAIASWGHFCASGHWVWYWKRRIDRRFIQKQDIKNSN